MKKKRLLQYAILLVAWLTVPWTAHSLEYLNETFDALTTGVPTGWDNSKGTTTNSAYRWQSHESGYNSTRGLRFNSYNNTSGNNNILLTPAVSFSTDASLKFWFKNAKGGDLSIAVTTDNGVNFDTLETNLKATDWTEKSYSLAAYKNQSSVRVAFLSTSNYGSGDAYHYLDDVSIADPALCAKPINLNVTGLTQTGATVNWTLHSEGGTPDKYDVKVMKASDNTVVYQDAALQPTGLSFPVTGLTAGTRYKVSMRGDCNATYGGFSPYSAAFEFTTLIAPVAVPYEQDFNASATDLPSGWMARNDNPTALTVSSTKHGTEGYSLKLQSTEAIPGTAITPQIGHAANDLQVTLWVYGSKDTKYSIGLMSDPTDPTSYIPLRQDSITKSSTWTEIRFNTASYIDATVNQVVAIMVTGGAYLYIDDVEIATIPSCPRPEQLKVSALDSISATLMWAGKAGVTSQQVCLMTATDTTYRITSGAQTTTLTGLTDNTSYSVALREICAAGDTSEWTSTVVEFTTTCRVRTSPIFTEGFESVTMPDCWMQIQTVPGTGSGTDYGNKAWKTMETSPYSHSGSRALMLPDAKKGTHTLLISQPIYIDQIGKYDISYWRYRNSNAKPDEGVTLWISNTPDTVGAQKCGYIPGSFKYAPTEESTGMYRYEYNIQRQGTVYIIFEGINQYGSEQYIDDLEVYLAPTCRKIDGKSISWSDTTLTSIDMTWDAGDKTSWLVDYKLTSTADTVTDMVQVNTTPKFTFGDLTPATAYKATGRIAAYCGVGDTSEWVSFNYSFVTPCEVITTFPYTEDFESTLFPPVCWTTRQTVAGTGGGADYGDKTWQRNTAPAYVSSGTGSAQLRNTKAGTRSILVTPQLDIPATGTYQVSFDMYRASSSKKLEGIKVWINSTPDTVGGTELLYIVRDIATAPTVSKEGFYTYSATLPATGLQYVIFEGLSFYGSSSYIDNIEIDEVPTCLAMAPFSVDSVLTDAARVNITDTATTSWQIEYGAVGFSLGTGTQLSFTGASGVITGLQPDTDYEVYIRRNCGADGYSAWSKTSQKFRTMCAPFAVTASTEFLETFETYALDDLIVNHCFTSVPSGSGTSVKDFKVAEKYSRGNVDYITPMAGSTKYAQANYTNYQWVFRAMTLRAGVNYEVSGYFTQDGTSETSTKISLGVATLPSADKVVKAVSDVYVINEWTLVSGFFNVPADGVYYVGWNIDQTGAPWCNAMDNLRVREVPCIPPTASVVTAVGRNTATINWTSLATEWELKVMTKETGGDANTDIIFNDTLTTKQQVLTGLSSNTEYYYYLRSICDGTPSDWTVAKSFRTKCDSYDVPLTEDFEDPMMTSLLCWTAMGEDPTAIRNTTYKYNGTASLKAENVTMVSPELNTTSLADYMITGWVRTTTDSTEFAIGVMLDPEDVTTYEQVGSVMVPKSGVWTEFTAYFTALATEDYADFAAAKHVALAVSGDNTFYFDDVMIDVTPTCPKPTEAVISEVGSDSFKLSWKANASETSWNVRLGRTGASVTDTVVTTNPAVIGGLTPMTTYEVQIAAICSASDTSYYTHCGSITTECAPISLPYILNFGTAENGSLPPCWNNVDKSNTSTSNVWKVYKSTSSAYILYDYDYYDGEWAIMHSPQVVLNDPNGARLNTSIANYEQDTLFIRLSNNAGRSFDFALDTIFSSYSSVSKNYSYDLSPYVGDTVMVEFKAISVEGGYYVYPEIRITDFAIEKIDQCTRPDTIKHKELSDTAVTIMLVDLDSTHTAWQMVYGTTGFDPATATPVVITATHQHTITGLSPQTTYDVYVRTVCEDGNSSWTKPYTFITECSSRNPLPYHEGCEFTSLSATCLSFLNFETDAEYDYYYDEYTYYPYLASSTYTKTEGERSLMVYTSDDEAAYIVLPGVDAPINETYITFDAKVSSSDESFELGVVTDATDIASYVSIGVPENVTGASFGTYEYHFNTATTAIPDGRIVIKVNPTTSYSGYSSYVYFDNIWVRKDSPCAGLSTFAFVDVASNSARLTATSNSDSIICVWGMAGLPADSMTNVMPVLTDTFTITGLATGTAYYAYTRTICDTIMGMWSRPVKFNTPCDVITLDRGDRYVENFDSYDDLAIPFPPCITVLESYEAEKVDYPTLDTKNAFDAKGLRMVGYNTIALPLFNQPTERLQMSFNVKGTGSLYVAVTDYLDADSVSDYLYKSTVSTSSKRDSIDFSTFGFTGEYMVLYTNSSTADLTIDSLVVEWAPTCYAPRNLRTTYISDTAAYLAWRVAPDMTACEYELRSSAGTVTGTTGTDGTLELHPLTPTTLYKFLIRGICGSGVDASYTAWDSISFTTIATPATIPFSYGFEDATENATWTFIQNASNTNRLFIGSATNAVKTGNNALYVSSDGGTTYDYDISSASRFSYITRLIYVEKGNYEATYSWKCLGESSYDYGRVYLAPASLKLTAGSDAYSSRNGCISLVSSSTTRINGSSSWKNEELTFSVPATGIYNLVISWTNDNSGGSQPPLALDDISIVEVNCINLAEIKMLNVSGTSAQFAIVNNNDTNRVEYCVIAGADTIQRDTVYADTIAISGLTLETDYTFAARAYCSEDAQTAWYPVNFSTTCEPVVVNATSPFFEGFEDFTEDGDTIRGCWFQPSSNTKQWTVRTEPVYGYSYDLEPYEGSNYATLIYSSNAKLIRNFTLRAGKSYEISVMATQDATSGAELSIVMSRNGKDTILTTAYINNSWKKVSYELATTDGGDYNIGVNGKLNITPWYMSIDNFSIIEIAYPEPTALAVDSITTRSARLTWASTSACDTFNVQILQGNTVVVDQQVKGYSYKATTLNPATRYTAKVQVVGSDGTSKWTSTTFTTECDVMNAPFFQDFENEDTYTIPQCWDRTTGSVLTKTANWQVISGKYLNIYTSSAEGWAEIRTPEVAIDDASLALSFDYKNTSVKDTLHVMISTDGGATWGTDILTATTTSEWTKFTYSLSAYNDQNVMVAFAVKAHYYGSGTSISIDNVRIKCVGADESFTDQICPNMPYQNEANGFDIPAVDIKEGVNIYRKFVPDTTLTGCDHYRVLTLTRLQGGTLTYEASTCEGVPYSDEYFQNLTEARMYQLTTQTEDGCDFTVTLNLRVNNPRLEIADTICEGDSYDFAGKQLYTGGVYTDTVKAAGSDCDSITTLRLTVLPTEFREVKVACPGEEYFWDNDTLITTTGVYTHRYTNAFGCDSILILDFKVLDDTTRIQETICEGRTYRFGTNALNESGVYTEIFETQSGAKCDSVVILTLTVIPADSVYVDDYVCEGHEYFGNGQQGLIIHQDTTIVSKAKTAEGCIYYDVLRLDFIASVVTYDTVTIADGGKYDFGGNSLTTAGDYEHTFRTEGQGCDSIVYLHLVVTTGVDHVTAQSLTLAPNPVRLGQPSAIHRDWTASERQGMRVEIIDAVGQMISSFTPDVYPIQTPAIEVSGIYYIRITSGTGDIYIGKLVVK